GRQQRCRKGARAGEGTVRHADLARRHPRRTAAARRKGVGPAGGGDSFGGREKADCRCRLPGVAALGALVGGDEGGESGTAFHADAADRHGLRRGGKGRAAIRGGEVQGAIVVRRAVFSTRKMAAPMAASLEKPGPCRPTYFAGRPCCREPLPTKC